MACISAKQVIAAYPVRRDEEYPISMKNCVELTLDIKAENSLFTSKA
jgi:hypothetical protein